MVSDYSQNAKKFEEFCLNYLGRRKDTNTQQFLNNIPDNFSIILIILFI